MAGAEVVFIMMVHHLPFCLYFLQYLTEERQSGWHAVSDALNSFSLTVKFRRTTDTKQQTGRQTDGRTYRQR